MFNKNLKILIIILLLPLVLLSREFTRSERNEQYKKAVKFEQKGEFDKAKNIFKTLYKYQPNNKSYFIHLKNILLAQKKYGQAIIIIEKWNLKHKINRVTNIELGTLYYHQNRKNEARTIWIPLLKDNKFQLINADLIFRYSLKYNSSDQLDEIVNFLREEVNDKDHLIIQYVSYLINRQNWDKLVSEIIVHLNNGGNEINRIKYKLYTIEQREKVFPILIAKLKNNINNEKIGVDIRLLLSDLYLNTAQYEQAVDMLIDLPKNLEMPLSEIKLLSHRLFSIKKYKHSIRAINYFLKHSNNSKEISEMLLLIGKSYEMNFREMSTLVNIVKSPFENKFTKIEFGNNLIENNSQLQKALSIYDSLSTYSKISNLKAEAYYQIGEIRFNILNDFDNALNDYLQSLRKINRDKKIDILNRIVDIYIAKGDRKSALEFIKNAPMKYQLSVKEEDELMLKKIQLNYLFGETDSLQEDIQATLSLISENSDLYNDILNFGFLIKELQKDTGTMNKFLMAERYLHQNRLPEAKLILEKILENNSEINQIISIRYITILRILNEADAENMFWDKFKDKLFKTNYSDYFMVKYGEFLEYFLNEKNNAETVYTNILVNYSDSPYFDTVRLHLRKIIGN
ncbi:MAG: tetratricopeptide repeat protein [Candidatus Marinimicrobia bacterium]|nr:tetratricopeptide repeat protein [Candidatus Neomarinimicrobiota bacterium]